MRGLKRSLFRRFPLRGALLDPRGAELEFRDLAERIERRVGEAPA
jgi:hypothetical protein